MDIKDKLAEVRLIEPLLTAYGIGLGAEDLISSYTKEELDKAFRQIRPDHVILVSELLMNCKKIKTINTNYGSYGLKHAVARALAKYTTNGELIAGMLVAGFTHKRMKNDSYGSKMTLHPNAYFNISTKSVKWLIANDQHRGW